MDRVTLQHTVLRLVRRLLRVFRRRRLFGPRLAGGGDVLLLRARLALRVGRLATGPFGGHGVEDEVERFGLFLFCFVWVGVGFFLWGGGFFSFS